MHCCSCLCCGSDAVVEPSEEFVSSITAARYIDYTSKDARPVAIGSVLLVRSRLRPTEAALLLQSKVVCCRPRLVAIVPLCTNIQIDLTCSSSSEGGKFEDAAAEDSRKVVIDFQEPPMQFDESRPLLPDADVDAGENGDAVEFDRQRFFKNLSLLRKTAERHSYAFPGSRGNHDWLWTYGADYLPRSMQAQWDSYRYVVNDEATEENKAKPSYVFGGESIRSFISDQGVAWQSIQRVLSERESEFLNDVPVKISTVTLNCGAMMPPSLSALVDLFGDTGGGDQPSVCAADISLLALQETCPLVNAIDGSGTLPARYHSAWTNRCLEAINTCGKFLLVTSVSLVGLLLLVFATEETASRISNIRTGVMGAGTFGLGNKGAVATSFLYCSTAICFVNSHLAAGEKEGNIDDRIEDFEIIVFKMRLLLDTEAQENLEKSTSMSKSSQSASLRHGSSERESWTSDREARTNLLEHDAIIWAGDMNMRLWKDASTKESVERSAVWECLGDARKQKLFMEAHDELHILRAKGGLYSAFEEAPVSFSPSYKLKPLPQRGKRVSLNAVPHASNEQYFYDAKRVPAWTDRVLWRTRGDVGIQPETYERISSVNFSDHRAVRLKLTLVAKDVRWDVLKQICAEPLSAQTSPNTDIPQRYDSVIDVHTSKMAEPENACHIL